MEGLLWAGSAQQQLLQQTALKSARLCASSSSQWFLLRLAPYTTESLQPMQHTHCTQGFSTHTLPFSCNTLKDTFLLIIKHITLS